MRRKNQNLAPDEAAILREIAAYHGYEQSRGEGKGRGSTFALMLAIVHGDAQVVSFDEDELRIVVSWLEEHGAALNGRIGELAAQLGVRLPRWEEGKSLPATEGDINTLDG